MRLRLGRLVGVLLSLVAAGLLAGCDVTGTATVRSDDYVDLDLRAVVSGDESCDWRFGETVRTDERPMWRGNERLCLLQGTVHKEELRRWGVSVAHLGERIEVSFNPLGVVTTSRRTAASVGINDLSVTVQFPGQVQESTGIVEGNSVRFTDMSQLARPSGLRAVALDHAGPPWTVVGGATAFGLGVLATALVWAWQHRRVHRDTVTAGLVASTGNAPGSPRLSQDVPPGGPAPGTLLASGLDASEAPMGGSGWERPGSDLPAPPSSGHPPSSGLPPPSGTPPDGGPGPGTQDRWAPPVS